MATNLELDNRLLGKAMKLGGMKTKREAVHEALEEYVRRREQLKVLDLFGSLEEDAADYNYKAQRRVK
jgi:Arc/MetJ family transcription regulator